MTDRSLDEFLGSDVADADDADASETDGSDIEGGDGAGCDDHGGDDGETEVAPVEPATSTYARDPAGGACAACGETVERRWQSDAGLVCPDCKEW